MAVWNFNRVERIQDLIVVYFTKQNLVMRNNKTNITMTVADARNLIEQLKQKLPTRQ